MFWPFNSLGIKNGNNVMTTLELVKLWQSESEPKIDLLELADCDDAITVTPTEIAGDFWIFIKTNLNQSNFPDSKTMLCLENSKTIFQFQPI